MCRRRIRKRCATIVTYPAASLKPLFTDPPESSKVRQVEFDCHLDFQRLDLVLPDGCRAEAFRKQIESTLTIETHRRWLEPRPRGQALKASGHRPFRISIVIRVDGPTSLGTLMVSTCSTT